MRSTTIRAGRDEIRDKKERDRRIYEARLGADKVPYPVIAADVGLCESQCREIARGEARAHGQCICVVDSHPTCHYWDCPRANESDDRILRRMDNTPVLADGTPNPDPAAWRRRTNVRPIKGQDIRRTDS